MIQVIILPPLATISDEDREAARAAGAIFVNAPEPSDVKVVVMDTIPVPLSGAALARIAIDAIVEGNHVGTKDRLLIALNDELKGHQS